MMKHLFTAGCLVALTLMSDSLVARDESCETPRFLLHMSNSSSGIEGTANLLFNGTPLTLYEGGPLEWNHYAVSALPCTGTETPGFTTDSDVVAGVFSGGGQDDTVADLVPDKCDGPVYLLGVNTVTDRAQYRIYASALSTAKIAQRHGFKRLFGGIPDPLLAGAWPKNTTATLSIWPCAEAFDTMYRSDWYQREILPLRKDSARYRLMTIKLIQ